MRLAAVLVARRRKSPQAASRPFKIAATRRRSLPMARCVRIRWLHMMCNMQHVQCAMCNVQLAHCTLHIMHSCRVQFLPHCTILAFECASRSAELPSIVADSTEITSSSPSQTATPRAPTRP